MENLAHALAGLLVAEAAIVWRDRREGREPTAHFSRLALLTSALSNNVPDADLLYVGITGGKLGYLLHHRGHTHTIAVGVLLGALVAAAVIAWVRWRGPALDRTDRAWLLMLGAFGPVVHVGMDAWNVYGVHPFWPIHP